jgi:hypothetical protein
MLRQRSWQVCLSGISGRTLFRAKDQGSVRPYIAMRPDPNVGASSLYVDEPYFVSSLRKSSP